MSVLLTVFEKQNQSFWNVLYAKCKNVCWANDLAVEFQARFNDADIPTDKRPTFKPHMTLVNQQGLRDSLFNATKIFENLANSSFGQHEIKQIYLINRASREIEKFDFK